MSTIEIVYKDFKKLYEKAKKEEAESFMYGNSEFLTAYAKYVLEYLEMENKKKKGGN